MKRLILILLVLPGIAFAQETETEPARKVMYQKATEIDFNAIDINAALARPILILSSERGHIDFGSFVELRKDFNPEMEASVHDVK